MKYLGNVGLRSQTDHDVQFLQFHIDGVIVFDKEHLDLLLQDLRPAQNQYMTHYSVAPSPKEKSQEGFNAFQVAGN